MKICILCSTPYQVFSAINIKLNYFSMESVDIYVFDYFKGADKLLRRLKKVKLFNQVIECPLKSLHGQLVKGNKLQRTYEKFKYHSFGKGQITRFFKNCIYDIVFYSNQDPVNEIIISELYRRNKKLIINHYEDGWVDYVFKDKYFYSKRAQKLNQFWKSPEDFFTRKNSYMYKPEMSEAYKDNHSIVNINIYPEKALTYINEVFGYTKESSIYGNVLYFDTLEENRLGISMEDHLKILEFCCSVIPKEDIVVKKHPRNFSEEYKLKGYSIYDFQSVPFEVICANQNFQNSLLISSFSTACFSPKILFGQEPYVILTYKLTGHEYEMDENTQCYLKRICENYSNPEKILVPENYQELKEGIILYKRYLENE